MPPTSSFGAAARTREDADVASLAEGVVDGAGIADRGGGRHDVVVARPAVDLVGAQAAGEDVVRAAAEDRRLLRRGRRRGDEVEAVGAVDGVGAGAGVDGVRSVSASPDAVVALADRRRRCR